MRSSISFFSYLRKRSGSINVINCFVFLVFLFRNGTKIQECHSKETRVATSYCVVSVIKRFSRRFSLLSTLFMFTALLALLAVSLSSSVSRWCRIVERLEIVRWTPTSATLCLLIYDIRLLPSLVSAGCATTVRRPFRPLSVSILLSCEVTRDEGASEIMYN